MKRNIFMDPVCELIMKYIEGKAFYRYENIICYLYKQRYETDDTDLNKYFTYH